MENEKTLLSNINILDFDRIAGWAYYKESDEPVLL